LVAAPPLLAEYAVGPQNGVNPAAAAAFNAGDYIVLIATTSDFVHKLGTPTGPPVDGWNRIQVSEVLDWGNAYGWIARCTANWSGTLTVPISVMGNAGAREAMWWCWRYDGRAGGFGASAMSRIASGTGAGTTVNTAQPNSAIHFGVVDWNAGAFGTDTQTLRVPAGNVGSVVKNYGLHTSAANWSYGRYTDVGVAGAKLVGIATPTNWKATIVAIEVWGDVVAPGTVPNIAATVLSGTQVRVDWGTATDNVGIGGYRVYDFGVQVADVGAAVRTFTHSGLAKNSQHQYTVRAYDTSGNLGGVLESRTVTTNLEEILKGDVPPKLVLCETPVIRAYLGDNQVYP
jgi:hypothetical protein